MRVGLLFPDADLSPIVRPSAEPLSTIERDLARDLGLPVIWDAMAGGMPHLWEVARSATLVLLADRRAIRYRQGVLADVRAHPEAARRLYEISCDAMQGNKRINDMLRRTPASTLRRSIDALEILLGHLRRLRAFAEDYRTKLTSEGMGLLVTTVLDELDDHFFDEAAEHLAQLRFKNGLWISAQLGAGNRGSGYVLRTPPELRSGRKPRFRVGASRQALSFQVHPRDETGKEALARFTDRGLNLVANALAQATDHILAFLAQLRTEIAFYLGCLNLEQRLASAEAQTCTPEPFDPGIGEVLSARGIYDAALVLRDQTTAVGNDVDSDGRKLVMITGANSGGKSTMLRAIGLAQLMMQCGMQVCASRYRASLCDALFTHFSRDEDRAMSRGRFDEELSRMKGIAERLTPHSTVLFNESFAGTTEWEGSAIAREIVRALVDAGVRTFFVTHLHELAERLFMQTPAPTLFLRAERLESGERTFKVLEGAPLSTSYGADIYERIGGFWPDTGTGA